MRHSLPRFVSMLPSTFLHGVLHTIERNSSHTVPAKIAGNVIRVALTFVLETQHTADLGTICDALSV
jgi:hypothetical protein